MTILQWKQKSDTKPLAPLVKICGLYRSEDIDAINRFQPDYVGFVLYVPKSHRNVTAEWLLEQAGNVDTSIQKVGVFVNPTVAQLKEVAPVLDVIQLHGNETEEDLFRLKDALSSFPHLSYWKAFSVKNKDDIQKALEFPADEILLDYGKGEGKSFDWNLLEQVTTPYILAGGITIHNVTLATEKLHPMMIDLSSGVETHKKKDEKKIKQLLETLHSL